MAIPTLEEYRRSCARWKFKHRGVSIVVSHHGVSDYSPAGIWCYYLIIDQRMFLNADDWALFDKQTQLKEFAGSFREYFPYEDIPDLDWHGGPTFGERNASIGRDGKPYTWLKVGCDYAHLFDQEAGYPYTLDSVLADAKRSADVLVDRFPQKLRCGYCGKIDHPDQFYTARNGQLVHVSQRGEFSEDHWPMWMAAA